jgi:hypothetical protein
MTHKNVVVLDENCHWLKLMYLFLRHVVYVLFCYYLLSSLISLLFQTELCISGSDSEQTGKKFSDNKRKQRRVNER